MVKAEREQMEEALVHCDSPVSEPSPHCWRTTGPTRSSTCWTEEEDKLLVDFVREDSYSNGSECDMDLDSACSTELTLGRSYGSEGNSVKAQKCKSAETGQSGSVNLNTTLQSDGSNNVTPHGVKISGYCIQIADHSVEYHSFPNTPLVLIDSSTSASSDTSPKIQYCYSTPPESMQNVYASSTSPKSRLKSLARTFKNTPSIIRKRACRTADHANSFGASCSTALNILSLDEAGCNSTDWNTSDYVKGLSSMRHIPQTSEVYKSLGRCLEHEFDAENDSGIANCGKVFYAYVGG